MLLSIIYLICGFVVLLTSADWVVKGGSSLAKRLHVPEIAIGLTIVAFGTSTPELIVNIASNLKGADDISFGNPIGANILNIIFILGITALICPLQVKHATTWKEIPIAFFSAFLVIFLCNDWLIDKSVGNLLTRWDSLMLLGAFSLFMIYIWKISKKGDVEVSEVKEYSILISVSALILGLCGLIFGGELVVNQAVKIAQSFGISQKIIGLTIVSMGTTLPELITSVTAAIKKHPDIAIGNIVGSNIFNILFILGASSLIQPLSYQTSFNADFLFMLFVEAILFLFMFTFKKHKLDRIEGIFFLILYFGYLYYLIT